MTDSDEFAAQSALEDGPPLDEVPLSAWAVTAEDEALTADLDLEERMSRVHWDFVDRMERSSWHGAPGWLATLEYDADSGYWCQPAWRRCLLSRLAGWIWLAALVLTALGRLDDDLGDSPEPLNDLNERPDPRPDLVLTSAPTHGPTTAPAVHFHPAGAAA